jgi:hypothetical protein
MERRYNSVSRIGITMEATGIGEFRCEFIRHFTPLTIATILRALPISGRLHKLGSTLIYLETGLKIGAEKQKTTFVKADITFMTSNGSLCVVLKGGTGIPMNPVGRFLGDPSRFNALSVGQVIVIKRSTTEN